METTKKERLYMLGDAVILGLMFGYWQENLFAGVFVFFLTFLIYKTLTLL